jgi:hypothetical protein
VARLAKAGSAVDIAPSQFEAELAALNKGRDENSKQVRVALKLAGSKFGLVERRVERRVATRTANRCVLLGNAWVTG